MLVRRSAQTDSDLASQHDKDGLVLSSAEAVVRSDLMPSDHPQDFPHARPLLPIRRRSSTATTRTSTRSSISNSPNCFRDLPGGGRKEEGPALEVVQDSLRKLEFPEPRIAHPPEVRQPSRFLVGILDELAQRSSGKS